MTSVSSEVGRKWIAFFHWGTWGDLYVATAALKEVANEFPDRPIVLLGSEKWLQIIDHEMWPTIRKIVASHDGRTGTAFEFNSGESQWRNVGSVRIRKLMGECEASFNVRTESLRYAWAPFIARVPRRHGSASGLLGRILYTRAAPWLGKDPVIHERDRMLQVIEAPDRIGSLAAKWNAQKGLPQLRHIKQMRCEKLARSQFKKYWLINPTSSRREKAWPAEKFRELCERLLPLLKARGIELKILGAPGEIEWLKEVAPRDLAHDTGIITPQSIADLIDVLSGARLLITNTSSVQFLAGAQKVRTITLMGRGRREIWGPLGADDIVIQEPQAPSDLELDIFKQEQRAYARISVNQVFDICRHLIDRE